MMMRPVLAAAAAAALLSACGTLRDRSPEPRMAPGEELIGETLRLETANGQTTMLRFKREGVVTAEFGDNSTTGSWVAAGNQLCFSWAGRSRDCWPYDRPFERGETVTVTSDRGNVVRVTLL